MENIQMETPGTPQAIFLKETPGILTKNYWKFPYRANRGAWCKDLLSILKIMEAPGTWLKNKQN